jgi:hypothetical protein
VKRNKMKTEKIYTQHAENTEWTNTLAFYKDDIKVMEKRLSELVTKNSSKDVLAKAEQFQNRLIISKNNIDILKHKINISNDEIHSNVNNNTVAVDHRSIKDHTDLRNEIKIFALNFTSLRSELNLFLVKWM